MQKELEFRKVDNKSSKAIFIFHGYGASMDDLYGLAQYLDPQNKFNWYFPNGHIEINLGFHMTGRAWFPIDAHALEAAMANGTFRNFKDANPDGLDEAIDVAKKFVVNHSHNYDSIIVGGFSQGAMISSYLSAQLPKVVSALFFSGVLVAQDKLMQMLDGKKSLPFFQSHGKQDPVLSYSEATMLYELLKLYGWQGELVPFDGAHEIPMPVISKASKFLSKFA